MPSGMPSTAMRGTVTTGQPSPEEAVFMIGLPVVCRMRLVDPPVSPGSGAGPQAGRPMKPSTSPASAAWAARISSRCSSRARYCGRVTEQPSSKRALRLSLSASGFFAIMFATDQALS